MQTTVEFKLERETKGTYRYQEVDQIQPKVGTLYVKKYVVGDKAPKTLKATLEWQE